MRKNAATAMEAKTMTSQRDLRGLESAPVSLPPPPPSVPMAKYFQPWREVQLQNCSKWLVVGAVAAAGAALVRSNSVLPEFDDDSEAVEAPVRPGRPMGGVASTE